MAENPTTFVPLKATSAETTKDLKAIRAEIKVIQTDMRNLTNAGQKVDDATLKRLADAQAAQRKITDLSKPNRELLKTANTVRRLKGDIASTVGMAQAAMQGSFLQVAAQTLQTGKARKLLSKLPGGIGARIGGLGGALAIGALAGEAVNAFIQEGIEYEESRKNLAESYLRLYKIKVDPVAVMATEKKFRENAKREYTESAKHLGLSAIETNPNLGVPAMLLSWWMDERNYNEREKEAVDKTAKRREAIKGARKHLKELGISEDDLKIEVGRAFKDMSNQDEQDAMDRLLSKNNTDILEFIDRVVVQQEAARKQFVAKQSNSEKYLEKEKQKIDSWLMQSRDKRMSAQALFGQVLSIDD